MSLLQSFKKRIEEFLAKHEMAPSRLGTDALNDPSFVFELREGRRPNPDLIDQVDKFMREYGAGQSGESKDTKQFARA
jgi:hypothetical protein